MELLQLWLSTHANAEQINPPSDLADLFLKTKKINRFVSQHYADGIFKDTVYDHTIRCVRLANSIPTLTGDRLAECVRTLWVHDIVELGDTLHLEEETADFTTIDLHLNPALNEVKITNEVKFADQHFSPDDRRRFMAFEEASLYLNGQSENNLNGARSALVAKAIDTIEGDLTFYHSLVKYCKQANFQLDNLPPGSIFLPGLKRCQARRQLLATISGDDEAALASSLFKQSYEYTRRVWLHELPLKYVPAEVKSFFKV